MKHRKKSLPRHRTVDAGQQQIVGAARAHFFSHGFRGVTMDDLAEELGVSKKTLYAHFPSKIALLEAVLADKFAGVQAKLNDIAHAYPHDFSGALHELLANMQRELDDIKPPFVRDMRQKAPHVFKTVERRRADLIERFFGKLFVEAQRTGMVRKDLPAKLMIEILLAAVQAIVNPAKVEELGLTPRTAFASVLRVVLDGVITNKGGRRESVLLCSGPTINAHCRRVHTPSSGRQLQRSAPEPFPGLCRGRSHQNRENLTPMKTNQQPESTTAGFLQTVSVAVAQLKQQLQRDYEQTYPELREIIHLVLDEEESRARELSVFPHLLLPDLVEAHVARLNLQPVETKPANILVSQHSDGVESYQTALAPCG
jgi:AcrR family transcriptional regulator